MYGRRLLNRLRRWYVDGSESTGFSRALQTLRGHLDLVRLKAAYPWLRNYQRLSAGVADRIRPCYDRYTSEVSPADMAVSFELCCFLSVVCDEMRPARILDLGSGLSSALFRLYCRTGEANAEVVSVDDAQEWLSETRAFLKSEGLPIGELCTWPRLLARDMGTFDLILHDMGNLQTRADALSDVFRHSRTGTLAVLDDVQSQFYRSCLNRFLKRSPRKPRVYSLRGLTLDRWGRYASLLVF